MGTLGTIFTTLSLKSFQIKRDKKSNFRLTIIFSWPFETVSHCVLVAIEKSKLNVIPIPSEIFLLFFCGFKNLSASKALKWYHYVFRWHLLGWSCWNSCIWGLAFFISSENFGHRLFNYCLSSILFYLSFCNSDHVHFNFLTLLLKWGTTKGTLCCSSLPHIPEYLCRFSISLFFCAAFWVVSSNLSSKSINAFQLCINYFSTNPLSF